MSTQFPVDYARLEAQAGSPIHLERIKDHVLREALHGLRTTQDKQATMLSQTVSMLGDMTKLLDRRTSALSPTKGFSNKVYQKNAHAMSEYLLHL